MMEPLKAGRKSHNIFVLYYSLISMLCCSVINFAELGAAERAIDLTNGILPPSGGLPLEVRFDRKY